MVSLLAPATRLHRHRALTFHYTDRGSVAICICTRDRPAELARTLASLAQASSPHHHVIVSDDGSHPQTYTACVDAPIPVDYLKGPRRGLGANRNNAVRRARSHYVLFLDDDCLLTPDFLPRALSCMADAERRLGSHRVIVTGTETKSGAIVYAQAQTFLGFQARPYRDNEELTSLVINATLFPLTMFSTLEFDEQITYGYEEVDLASRAAYAGYSIVSCPAALNDHRPSPRSRHDYLSASLTSRLYVTFKRYAFTERRFALAAWFALIAPLHAIAAAIRARGVRAVLPTLRSLFLAGQLVARFRSTRPRSA
jgi:GT2 family glycosyltransferase